jgi:hypothetical protein
MLEHGQVECTGEWRLVLRGGERYIACACCGAAYPATPPRGRNGVAGDLDVTFPRRPDPDPDLGKAA